MGLICHCCFRALLGSGTHEIHVSLRVFGLCSVSDIKLMSLVGFAVDEAERSWAQKKIDISSSAQSQSCHLCLAFTDVAASLEDG